MTKRNKAIIAFVVVALISVFYSGSIHKAIVYIQVKSSTPIAQIELIQKSTYGKPLTLVIGKNTDGAYSCLDEFNSSLL